MKLIDKDKVVVEIGRRIKEITKEYQESKNIQYTLLGKINALENLLPFLDTLEVKEDNLFTEKVIERELAEAYINVFDKKFGNKLPELKGTQLHDFKNFINTCEQTFCMKYFDYHAMQGKLFEKLALLWVVWGKEHLSTGVKEVDLEKEIKLWFDYGLPNNEELLNYIKETAEHFYELGLKAKGE